jgi:seryl-tRNA synthetase
VTRDAVEAVGEIVERVSAIEKITQSVAAAAEQQTAATGEIARNVSEAADAIRGVSAQIGLVRKEMQTTDSAIGDMREAATTVAERIDELRGVMVRIVRTSSDAANRLREKRVRMLEPAFLLVNGRVLNVTCLDLSRGGARLDLPEDLPDRTAVQLRLPGLPDLPGHLTNGGRNVSLQFDWELDAAPAALVARIDSAQAA